MTLTPEDRRALESWLHAEDEPRLADRARIILAAAEGQSTLQIARTQQMRTATVSKWRVRFSHAGLRGLQDAPRPGARPRYDGSERRILAKSNEAPPRGHPTWTGSLVAEALGDVSKHQVWRVLREKGRHLRRRRSWHVRTEPLFAARTVEVAGLHLDPPENAMVLAMAGNPGPPAARQPDRCLKLPYGKVAQEVQRDGRAPRIATLMAALELFSRTVTDLGPRRRRSDILSFLSKVATAYPHQELHVILDNVPRQPRLDRWLARHGNVSLHFAPTHACWLHQIECWISMLGRRDVPGAPPASPQQIREAIEQFTGAGDSQPMPFEWTSTS